MEDYTVEKNIYPGDMNEQAIAMFPELTNQLATRESATEQRKARVKCCGYSL